IGQFWHWNMYKQRLPMTVWVLFNLITSGFYLVFWHMTVQNPKLEGAFGGHTATAWFQMVFHGAAVDISFSNWYWSLLWFGFSLFQLLLAGALFWIERRDREQRRLQLEGAPA